MSRIGIIGAMEVEVALLQARMENRRQITKAGLDFYTGTLNGTEVVVVRSGIGKVNAALCAQRLIMEFGVTHMINTGIAGATGKGLKVLDFVVSTDALYHDMDVTGFGYKLTEIPQMKVSDFPADKRLVELAVAAFKSLPEASGHDVTAGRIASGDQFIADKVRKDHIKEICSPACVEMEGAAIAHACFVNDVPFVVIRCMSDMADTGHEAVYDFNEKTAAELSAGLVMELLKKI